MSKCFRCKKELNKNEHMFCDLCMNENRIYLFLDMTVKDYNYYVENIGCPGNFQQWVDFSVQSHEYSSWVTQIDITILNDSLMEM